VNKKILISVRREHPQVFLLDSGNYMFRENKSDCCHQSDMVCNSADGTKLPALVIHVWSHCLKLLIAACVLLCFFNKSAFQRHGIISDPKCRITTSSSRSIKTPSVLLLPIHQKLFVRDKSVNFP